MKFITRIISTLIGSQQAESLTSTVLTSSVGLFILHCSSILLGFLSNLVLIRLAGTDVFGGYVYVVNLLTLLVGFSTAGADTLVLSRIPQYLKNDHHSLLKGLLRTACLTAMLASACTAAITYFVDFIHSTIEMKVRVNWMLLAFPALSMLSITAVGQAALQGAGRPLASQIVEKVLRPVLMIGIVFICVLTSLQLTIETLVWINIFTIAIGVLVVFKLLSSNLPGELLKVKPSYDKQVWRNASARFFAFGIVSMINSRVDLILLDLFENNTNVGMYATVAKVSDLLRFSSIILDFILAPMIVKMFDPESKLRLQKILTRSARVVFAITCALFLLITLFADPLLAIFDETYSAAKTPLIILCLGQLVNVFFGSVSTILLMSSNQLLSIVSLCAGIAMNVCLSLLLVPLYGITGAALASTAGLITWKLLMYVFVRSKTGLRTTPLTWM